MSFVNNILRVHAQAMPEEIQSGMTWYEDARSQCQELSDKHEVPLRISVGVTCALSPNNRWTRNITDADNLITAYLNGDSVESATVCTYKKMRDKAWSIMTEMPDDDPTLAKILNGQKITSFFYNIMGHDTCTIDGHAYNIATGERRGLSEGSIRLGKGRYQELQDAYRVAAHSVSIKAYQMQAITWTTWKRIHNV